jgi:hypothetical protein
LEIQHEWDPIHVGYVAWGFVAWGFVAWGFVA